MSTNVVAAMSCLPGPTAVFVVSDKSNVLSDYLGNLGRKGRKALAKRLTPEQRSERAPKAA